MRIRRLFLLVLVSCGAVPPGSARASGGRPNVLFIAIDDFRPEMAAYGSAQIKTPHLDAFARGALRFDRAYCQVPVCGASRASLMTSILPTVTRFRIADTHADDDAPGVPTLPEVFRSAGYVTRANGKLFHHADDTAARSWSRPVWNPSIGHSEALDPATTQRLSERGRGRIWEAPAVPDNAYKDGRVAEHTVADLRELAGGDQPFFLACGFIRPHLPFYAPKRYWDLYRREEIKIAAFRQKPAGAPGALRGSNEWRSYHPGDDDPATDDWHRLMRHGYYAAASYADQLTGNVLTELERLGLADNTIVVIWGDHGWHLGEHNMWGKHNTLHQALRVPLLMRVPDAVANGQGTAAIVELLDLFPTLCNLAGIEAPATVQGRSFVDLFTAPAAPGKPYAFSRFGPGTAVIAPDAIYTLYQDGSEMLYDLARDPGETRNVAADPDYATTRASLRSALAARLAEAESAAVPAPLTDRP